MSKHYSSCYGLHLKQFVDMKRTLGFKYKTEAVILYQIDRLAEETEELSHGITKEFAGKWCKKRCYEGDFYRYTRIRVLASFSSYLRDLGIDSYIPNFPVINRIRLSPISTLERRLNQSLVRVMTCGWQKPSETPTCSLCQY